MDFIKDDVQFRVEDSIIHLILNDDERPMWSVVLERSYTQFGEILNMQNNYRKHIHDAENNKELLEFFDFITEQSGIIIDLASGPSGYFSPVFSKLNAASSFYATDACPTVVNAHAIAGTKVIDMDLDKPLPFKDNSITAFSGNLLSNVENYRALICEVYRTLIPGGRFAVIESVYEAGSETYQYLLSKNAVYSSVETYINYLQKVGFAYCGGNILKEQEGKIDDGDLLPIGEHDKAYIQTMMFQK